MLVGNLYMFPAYSDVECGLLTTCVRCESLSIFLFVFHVRCKQRNLCVALLFILNEIHTPPIRLTPNDKNKKKIHYHHYQDIFLREKAVRRG